jgi:hypothetical protein
MLSSRSLPAFIRLAAVATLVAGGAIACGGGDTPAPEPTDEELGYVTEYAKAQRVFIDSVVKAAASVEDVAKSKGPVYQVADEELAEIVRREAEKTRDCYDSVGRGYDPYLAGVVTMLVNLGGGGWDLVRVEEHEFSSPAGGVVVSCINARAKNEWVLPTDGVKPGAHLVQIVYRPDRRQQ